MLRAGCTSGLTTAPQMLGHPPVHAAMGIRLHPLAARLVLGRPLHEITDWLVTLDELLGAEANALLDACIAEPSPAARLRRFVGWVERRLVDATRAPMIDLRVAFVARRLEASHGAASIAALRDESGAGKNRLLAGFRDALGVSPRSTRACCASPARSRSSTSRGRARSPRSRSRPATTTSRT